MTKDGVGKIFKGWWKNLIGNHVPVPTRPKSSNPCKLKIILNLPTVAKRVLSSSALQSSKSEIEQALFLCAGFADRVCAEAEAAEDLEYLGRPQRPTAPVFQTNGRLLV